MSGDADEEVVRRAQAMIGTVVKDKWKIERLIGVGGMAVVYQATHRNKKRAAIKMLHPEFSNDPRIRARFLREGYVANTVAHPGAVRVDDDDVNDDGAAFLVMELLEGETVEARRVRQGGRLSAAEALSMAHQLLDVLSAAHAKGVVHRDLKPDNLFLNRDGQLKVLDFGIARLQELSSKIVQTQTGSLLGTPAFMAPEQARGRWDLVDARTDLWAVGATLFALLTGRFVHEAETLNEALALAVTQPSPRIGTVVPEIHPLVAEVVDCALAYRPDDRYADAQMMQDAVQRAYSALTGEDVPPRAPAPPPISGATPTPDSLDVPIEIERTPQPASDVAVSPPLRAPHPMLASAPAVTAGLRAPRTPGKRPLFWVVAVGGVALVAGAAGTALVKSAAPEPESFSSSAAGKPENTPVPPPAVVRAIPSSEPLASVTLAEPAKEMQPAAPKPAAPSVEPRAKSGPLAKAKPRGAPPPPAGQESSPAPSKAAPKKSSDPFAKRR